MTLDAQTSVPQDYVKDGQIVVNISPTAIRDLQLLDESIQFSGRFAGIPHEIYAPHRCCDGDLRKRERAGHVVPKGRCRAGTVAHLKTKEEATFPESNQVI